MRFLRAAGFWLAAAVVVAAPASARTEATSAYSKAQTYSGALRYLRVDLGYEITERDPDAAYLLFKFTPTGRKTPTNGSVEIVESDDKVKFVVQLPQLPSYHELVLRDGLLRKLATEYGAPPKKKPDAGKDKDKSKDGDRGKDEPPPEAPPKRD